MYLFILYLKNTNILLFFAQQHTLKSGVIFILYEYGYNYTATVTFWTFLTIFWHWQFLYSSHSPLCFSNFSLAELEPISVHFQLHSFLVMKIQKYTLTDALLQHTFLSWTMVS